MRRISAPNISLLRSFQNFGLSRFYKHLVPPGLTTALLLCLLFVLANCQKRAVEPVALTREDMCSYCRMAISEKQYAAQLIDGEGQASKFDDIGCMTNFIDSKKNSPKPAAYFVMDFDERQWVKAEDAFYVRSEELQTPMNKAIVAFRNQSNAQQAVEKYKGQLLRFKDIFKAGP
jgi:copper chaperone NosL